MFFGELPFKDKNDFKYFVKNIKATYTNCDNISNEFKDLLDKMLNKNPSRRITIEECLSHPWVRKQNTDIILDEEEINKQQQLLKTKTNKSKNEGKRKKSYKSGKINKLDKELIMSENNSYKNNLIDIPLHRNSSSIISDSINNEKDFKIKSNKNDMNITNESTKERIKINSHNNINKFNLDMSKKNINLNINKNYNSEIGKINQIAKKKSLKRISSLSADKNIEIQKTKIFPPLIEITLEYIKYYICIHFHKKKEKEKIAKIFRELDSQNNNYLLYNKVYLACASYKDNKNISFQSLSNDNNNNYNNDKKYNIEEFINILIEEKNKYINNNFKNIFNSIKQPNIDEIIKIYKDQEPIDFYKKYIKYIKEIIKLIQENHIKTNYLFNEFVTLLDNAIDKIYKNNSSSKLEKLGRTYTKKIVNSKISKNQSNLKRSNTFLKHPEKNADKNNKKKKKSQMEMSKSIINNIEVFDPEKFLSLTKK